MGSVVVMGRVGVVERVGIVSRVGVVRHLGVVSRVGVSSVVVVPCGRGVQNWRGDPASVMSRVTASPELNSVGPFEDARRVRNKRGEQSRCEQRRRGEPCGRGGPNWPDDLAGVMGRVRRVQN